MTLVVLASMPIIALGGIVFASASGKKSEDYEKEYASAGGLAEQALSGIKTVKSLNGEHF